MDVLMIHAPAKVKLNPKRTLIITYVSAIAACPVLMRLNVSPENAENVVKPPSTPVTSKSLVSVVTSVFSKRPNSKPINRQPNRFTSKVPYGNPEGVFACTNVDSR